jgi:hypothetical protein
LVGVFRKESEQGSYAAGILVLSWGIYTHPKLFRDCGHIYAYSSAAIMVPLLSDCGGMDFCHLKYPVGASA